MSPCGGHGVLPGTLSGCGSFACRETGLTVSHGLASGLASTYLSDDLRRFSVIDGFEILLHSSIIVLLGIQVVAKFAKDDVLLGRVQSGLLGQVDSQNIQITLVEYVEFLRKRLFMIPENLNTVSSKLGQSVGIVPFHRL